MGDKAGVQRWRIVQVRHDQSLSDSRRLSDVPEDCPRERSDGCQLA